MKLNRCSFNPYPIFGGLGLGACGGASSYESKFLIYQNFENPGATGYDNGESWISSINGDGILDSKYTTSPAPLRGSQSLYISLGTTGTVGYAYTPNFTGQDDIYLRFLFRVITLAPSGTTTIGALRDTSGAGIANIKYYSSGQLACDCTNSVNVPDMILASGHTYCIWFEFHKGTGSNASVRCYCAMDSTTKPATYGGVTNGAATTQAGRFALELNNSAHGAVSIFDQLIISTSPIGSGDRP